MMLRIILSFHNFFDVFCYCSASCRI